MSDERDLSKLTTEELMELAKKALKEPLKKNKLSEIKRFIIAEDLQDGDDFIQGYFVYQKYLKWSYENISNPMNYLSFTRQLALHFRKKIKFKMVGFLMSAKGFDLTPQNEALAIEKRNSHYGKERKKKKPVQTKKERKSKISEQKGSDES